jgi:PAS domain S-box-containing protein
LKPERVVIRGFLVAAVFAAAAVVLREWVVELVPPRFLDIFLVGIGATSYLFSWVPALFLLLASLAIAVYFYPVDAGPGMVPALLRLGLYTLGSVGLIVAFHRLRAAVRHWRGTEQALREREAVTRSILETAVDAIITTNEQGLVLSFNPAAERMFGYTAGEVIGRNVSMLMPSPQREEHDQYMAEYLRTGAKRVIGIGREVKGRHKDGSIFPVELALSEAELPGRRTFTGVLRDITERQRMEEQLRQAVKMEAVGRLAGGVAHDFNNTLTVITGYSRMLLERLDLPEEFQGEIEEIAQAADRAAELTSQLLIFSRRHAVHAQVVDLNRLVAGLEKMLRRLLGEDIELITTLRRGSGKIKVDPGHLEQVIVNLAVNARDAMPDGGCLTIETEEVELGENYVRRHVSSVPGRFIMLAISDNGRGMDAATRNRIFEPFFTTKERGKGTGLGLSTVYGIIKQSGGDIWVYSEPGKGTTFKIYLPVAVEPEGSSVQEAPVEGPPRGRETILLVEDEPSVRRLVHAILSQQGYRVLEAADPGSALRMCEENEGQIDMLLTDVVMPQMNGRELARQVAGIRPGLKILFVSGYTDTVIAQHGVSALDGAFLQKPFTPESLARKVREVLDEPSGGCPSTPAIRQ